MNLHQQQTTLSSISSSYVNYHPSQVGMQNGNGCFTHSNSSSSISDPFPRLSQEELRCQLSRMSIELTPSVWKNPQPEDALGLYSIAVEDIFNKKIQDIRQEENIHDFVNAVIPKVEGLDILSMDGRLHVSAIGNLRFFRLCQKLCFQVLGLQDFNRNHLFKPDSNSIMRFSSAFVNFLKFRECLYSELHHQVELLDDLTNNKYIPLVDQVKVFKFQLYRLMIERDNKKNETEGIKNENRELYFSSQELNLKYKKLMEINAEKRKKINSMQAEDNELELTIIAERQHLDDLKEQIVQSPEKLRQMQKDVESEILLKENCLNRTKDEIMENLNRLEIEEKSRRKIVKLGDVLENHINNNLEPFEIDRLERKAVEKKLKVLENDEINLADEQTNKIEQIKNIKENIIMAEEKWSKRECDAFQRLKLIKSNAEASKYRLDEINREIENKKSSASCIFQKIQEEVERADEILRLIDSMTKGLENHSSHVFDTYNNIIGEAYDMLVGGVTPSNIPIENLKIGGTKEYSINEEKERKEFIEFTKKTENKGLIIDDVCN